MKKSAILFFLFSFLLTSCGAKKNVATNVESTPVETEQSENITEADSLPEFLREFANDSTIHINWAYGIPFIIDDSVPMLLPPIDNEPTNYVTKPIYVRYYYHGMTQETVSAIIDSIPWINKCINETKDFVESHYRNSYLYQHLFDYRFYLSENAANKIIEVKVFVHPVWDCAVMPDAYNLCYSYFFDLSGKLLGKMAIRMPFRIGYQRDPQYYLRKTIPNYNEFRSILNTEISQNKQLTEFGVFTTDDDCGKGFTDNDVLIYHNN